MGNAERGLPSWPVLFTIITLKSNSWFRSAGDLPVAAHIDRGS